MYRHSPIDLLLQSPHRAGFLPGMLAACLLLALWGAELLSRLTGHITLLSIGISQAHGMLMLFCVFPFFMCGFCFTAVPRWLNVDAPSARQFLPAPGLLAAGTLLWLTGLWQGPALLLAGSLALFAGLGWLLASLGGMIRRSRTADRHHALAVCAGLSAGAISLLCLAAQFAEGLAAGWFWARELALYGFLLPVFLAVSHRMLPFFSQAALPQYLPWRPKALLWSWAIALPLVALLKLAALPVWPLHLLLATLFGYTSWRWQLRRSLDIKLLAMLHLAFVWLCPAFLLLAAADLGWVSPFAGLHALTLGFCLCMLVGFASRVMLGHSGRPLQASPQLWRLYCLLHAGAALRILADLLPTSAMGWHAAAGGLLLLLLSGWLHMSWPWLLAPRADGKPG